MDMDNRKTKISLNEIQTSTMKNAPLEWRCDTYCRKVRHVKCEGEKHINPEAPNLCPYFDEMLY